MKVSEDELATAKIKKLILALACVMALGACLGALPTRADDEVVLMAKDFKGDPANASFDHASKKHRTVKCSTCHKVTVDQPNVTKFPGHAACISCHNLAVEALFKPTKNCAICHSKLPVSKAQTYMLDFVTKTRQLTSDFGIDFSHPSHRKPVPADVMFVRSPESKFKVAVGASPRCDDCHQRIATRRTDDMEMVIEKGHSTCFQCHGEKPAAPRQDFPYMNDCAQCHDLQGAKAPHLYGIVKTFHHEDHETYNDTRSVKKVEYRVKPGDYLCAECHKTVDAAKKLSDIKLPEEMTCNLCHNGKLGLPDPLAANTLQEIRNSSRRN
ncbi:MAG: cytochrome c3 family protein [Acidobacteria bacterium]|nr:cytochrome c3 family protein [Acidobacteriota bacterium]